MDTAACKNEESVMRSDIKLLITSLFGKLEELRRAGLVDGKPLGVYVGNAIRELAELDRRL